VARGFAVGRGNASASGGISATRVQQASRLLGSETFSLDRSIRSRSVKPLFQARRLFSAETREFQAETRKLLDIVTNSIYTDKEVFLRELISNASDALEKFRYLQVNDKVEAQGSDSPAEISITTNKDANTLTIVDTGIGMTKDELVSNLGTIARSGSKQFVQSLKEGGGGSTEGIIGQFGVGFYSSFMVSDTVTVESISGAKAADAAAAGTSAKPHRWSSDGTGVYTIEESDPSASPELVRGSKITMRLKESCKEFSDPDRIKEIIKRYSSFVSFPIKVNGEVCNTVSAIWMKDKKEVSEEQYLDFYKFLTSGYDKPKYTLHFRTDAPLDLKCLFYIPSFHTEKFGFGRMEPGVNLYSRKVLIESKPSDLLPDWLRFIKGVVDSEDLPLSLSREKPQDSKLLGRVRDVLVRKLVRFLEEQSKNDPKAFKEFYIEYNYFLKEGVCQDYRYMDSISKLLLFETSMQPAGEVCSFDDYVSRCAPEQKNVYYLVAPSRDAALASPYYETFKKHGIEVLFLYSTIDDFVMNNVKTFAGRPLVSAETSSVDLKAEGRGSSTVEDAKTDADAAKADGAPAELTEEQAKELCTWLTSVLGARVREVRTTTRLSDSPAIVTDHESGALRRMMKMVNEANAGRSAELPPQVMEINPSHKIIRYLSAARAADASKPVAELIAQQIFDNCLVAAGLVDDPRTMLPRLNRIIEETLAQR